MFCPIYTEEKASRKGRDKEPRAVLLVMCWMCTVDGSKWMETGSLVLVHPGCLWKLFQLCLITQLWCGPSLLQDELFSPCMPIDTQWRRFDPMKLAMTFLICNIPNWINARISNTVSWDNVEILWFCYVKLSFKNWEKALYKCVMKKKFIWKGFLLKSKIAEKDRRPISRVLSKVDRRNNVLAFSFFLCFYYVLFF